MLRSSSIAVVAAMATSAMAELVLLPASARSSHRVHIADKARRSFRAHLNREALRQARIASGLLSETEQDRLSKAHWKRIDRGGRLQHTGGAIAL